MDTGRANAAGTRNGALRIAVVTETYPPEINGVANTVFHMVYGLADRGHDIVVLRPAQGRRDRSPARSGNIREIATMGAPLPFYEGLQLGLPAGRVIERTFRDFGPDLAYVATEGPLGMSARKSARRLHLPVIAGFHTNFQTYSRHYGIGLLAPAVLSYLRRFHNRCDRTLVPTRQLADELGSRGFQRLSVWPRGVDTTLFDPRRRNPRLRNRWGVADDGLAVLYVGRIAPEKNIRLAIDAFEAIRQHRPEARFVVVGDGPETGRLRATHPEFVFAGAKVGEDLAAHYASADLFLFPSVTETFGNVVTEAMSSGIAIVAFELAAAREHLRDGVNGLLALPGDETGFIGQALRAAESGTLRQALGAQARRDGQLLGWAGVIERLERIIGETLAHPLDGESRAGKVATAE